MARGSVHHRSPGEGDPRADWRAEELEEQISRVALLKDPVRRALYAYVRDRSADVSRDEAAEALGITRATAAFHLDRLAGEGLLEATYRRTSARTGPGSGRPSKLYRSSPLQIQISVPPRNYELAARILEQAFAGGRSERHSRRAVRTLGRKLAAHATPRGRARRGAVRSLEALLEGNGYEPKRRSRGRVELANCPFDALVDECPAVICQLNLALMEGVLEGLDLAALKVELDCEADGCCVRFVSSAA
jgi:predicted ArsR family transcriptional regulator